MPESFHQRIAHALSRVVSPRHRADVLAADLVRDVATTTSGRVRLTLLLSAEDSPTLARDVRQAVEGVEGVTEVRVEVRDPAELSGRPAPS
jgi:ATP-binding protein involved in chromosome partitioning